MSNEASRAKLAALISRLSNLPSGLGEEVAQKTAPIIQRKVEACFEGAHDPYGNAWAETKAGNHPLEGLDEGLTFRAQGTQVIVDTPKDYFGYHQTGTRNMPARPPLPSGELPADWKEEIGEAATEVVKRRLGV